MFLPWMVITMVKTGFFFNMEEIISSIPFWEEMEGTKNSTKLSSKFRVILNLTNIKHNNILFMQFIHI